MSWIEIRAGSTCAEVMGVDQNRITSIRSVVQGVAMRIRASSGERSVRAPQRYLKCVIGGIGYILQGENSSQTRIRTRERVHIGDVRRSACRLQMDIRGILRGHYRSVLQQEWNTAVPGVASSYDGRNRAIRQGHRFIWTERIVA